MTRGRSKQRPALLPFPPTAQDRERMRLMEAMNAAITDVYRVMAGYPPIHTRGQTMSDGILIQLGPVGRGDGNKVLLSDGRDILPHLAAQAIHIEAKPDDATRAVIVSRLLRAAVVDVLPENVTVVTADAAAQRYLDAISEIREWAQAKYSEWAQGIGTNAERLAALELLFKTLKTLEDAEIAARSGAQEAT